MFVRVVKTAILLASVAFVQVHGVCAAQNQPAPVAKPNLNEQLKQAMALIRGQGVKRDAAAGLELLESLATQDAAAKLALAALLFAGPEVSNDQPRALALLNELISAGNAGAMSFLGKAYLDGNDITADPVKATGLLEQAVSLGSNGARVNLAIALIKGQGLAKDTARGQKLLEDGMAKDAGSKLALANFLLAGPDLPQDQTRALTLFNELIAKGNSGAVAALGKAYLEGLAIPSDPLRARGLLQQAVNLGHGGARLALANALIKGQGLPKDVTAGQKLLEEGAAKDASAKLALANYLFVGTDLVQDTGKALALLNELVSDGSVGAMVTLGKAYLEGATIPPDPDKALDLLSRAAKLNSGGARFALAQAFLKGQGLGKDTALGQRYLEESAAKDPGAKLALANYLLAGTDLPRDQTRAIAVLNELISTGNPAAMAALGKAYLEGVALPADPVRAKGLLQQAIRLGNGGARIILASALIKGQGVKQNLKEGQALLEEAASRDQVAKLALANFLLSGAELPKDSARATVMLEELVTVGNLGAKVGLGKALLEGADVKADPARAQKLLEEALAAGSSGARVGLANALIKGSGLPRDVAAGQKLLEDGAAKDQGTRMTLANYLMEGFYLAPDRTRAFDIYKSEAATGNVNAMLAMGNAYLFGRGVNADPVEARRWFDMAIAAGSTAAARMLGENLIKGTGLPKNTKEGTSILKQIASKDPSAKTLLVTYFTSGQYMPRDIPQAAKFAKEAASEKAPAGLLTLGQYYLSLPKSSKNGALAATYLVKAANAGLGQAWLNYANGIAQTKVASRPINFRTAIAKAKSAKITGAAVAEANAHIYGSAGFLPSRKAYLAILESAARNGNADAAKALIRTFRDGIRGRIGRNPKTATAYLSAYRNLLGADRVDIENTLAAAANARNQKEFQAVLDLGGFNRVLPRPQVQYELYAANPNFQTYRLQKRLLLTGKYKGKADGFMNPATLAAIRTICAAENAGKPCAAPVANPGYVGYLITIWAQR